MAEAEVAFGRAAALDQKRWLRQRVQLENDGFLSVTAFEPNANAFCDWFFSSDGLIFGPSTGRWDAATHTITWTNLPEAGVVLIMTFRFIDADTTVGAILIRDREGKTIFEVSSEMKRTTIPVVLTGIGIMTPFIWDSWRYWAGHRR